MLKYTEPQEEMTNAQFWCSLVLIIGTIWAGLFVINGGLPNDCCPEGCASTCQQMEKADESP